MLISRRSIYTSLATVLFTSGKAAADSVTPSYIGRNHYYSGPVSDHFDGARFFNTSPATEDKTIFDWFRWRLTSRPVPWPESVPVEMLAPARRSEATRITVVGHATVLIQGRGLNLVTDPIWSERAGSWPFLSPKRVCPPAVSFDSLPAIDVVLLSHNHNDHLDLDVLRRLVSRDSPLILTPLGNDALIHQSIPEARIEGYDWWAGRSLANDVEVTCVPAQHWSLTGPWDRRMALWGGFALRMRDELIYFAGDTGYGDGGVFRAIRQRFGSPTVALLPLGAYEPRWLMADNHLNPGDAVTIFQELDARQAIGIHWGVFPLSDEGRAAPREALADALSKNGIDFGRFLAAEPGFVWG
jgi:L-ascorbate metabolism protein UlaG (beta-lactamase superfamily)